MDRHSLARAGRRRADACCQRQRVPDAPGHVKALEDITGRAGQQSSAAYRRQPFSSPAAGMPSVSRRSPSAAHGSGEMSSAEGGPSFTVDGGRKRANDKWNCARENITPATGEPGSSGGRHHQPVPPRLSWRCCLFGSQRRPIGRRGDHILSPPEHRRAPGIR